MSGQPKEKTMTKKIAAFFSVLAFASAMMAGVSYAGDRPEKVGSLSELSPAEVLAAMLQTGN